MGTKPLWIGTSWKMNKGPAEAAEAARILAEAELPRHVRPFVMPPFTSLQAVCDRLAASPIAVGAQNMHWEEGGAWTGEISPLMIRECGASLVELGHSERRTHFGETDRTVNLKVRSALAHGLRPLVCIGDTAEEHGFGATHETLARQLRIALHGVAPGQFGQVLIAYEPVWAIGSGGTPADAGFVGDAHRRLRAVLVDMAGEAGEQVPLLYGGSVTRANAGGYVAQPDVDGVFVGRAAWAAPDYLALVRSLA
jgi:L-erythrulose 1-phosphate isomerase